jgi:ABC-type sulfate transport system permease component
VALLLAFGRTGFIGRYLDDWFGLTIPFTPLAVVMAETFVTILRWCWYGSVQLRSIPLTGTSYTAWFIR